MADTERDRAIRRFESLVSSSASIQITRHPETYRQTSDVFGDPIEVPIPAWNQINRMDLQRWVTRAENALADVLPAGHPVLRRWAALGQVDAWSEEHIAQAGGIVAGLLDELRDGLIVEPLSARLRAATEYELLDHARALCAQGDAWAAAGALLAGAALELRLHDFARARAVSLGAKPTMGSVIKALRDARQAGTPSIASSDDALLDRWLTMRNEAAHRTSSFQWSATQIAAELAPLDAFLRSAHP